jgi:hypothetical protein
MTDPNIISTDDAAARDLTFVWKGPPDSPMPFEARYQAWGGVLVLAPLLAFATYLLLFPLDLLPLHAILAILLRGVVALTVGAVLAVALVRRFGQVVTPTRPLSHHLAVLLAEVNAPRKKHVVKHTHAARHSPDRRRTVTIERHS